MFSMRSVLRLVLVTLVVLTMVGLPMAAGAQTTNGITSPANGAAVSGNVVVTGFASDPNFSKWQLDLLPNGNTDAAFFLALGIQSGVFTYTLNTTPLPAGEHALRLRVVRTDSNYDEYVTKFTTGAAAAATPAATRAAATRPVTATVAAATRTVTATVAAARPAASATPAPPAPTTNGISSPKSGATVGGSVVVTGFANDPNFGKWQLDLLPNGRSDAAIFLGLGIQPGVFTYTWNTKSYVEGPSALRLRVVRTDSNYDEFTNPITISQSAAAAPAAPAATRRATATAAARPALTRTLTATVATTRTTPAATPAPAAAAGGNGITSPANGATVSGTVVVTGNANDPNFNKWQLDLMPAGHDEAISFLGLGIQPGVFTYTLNTAPYPAGAYALRLRVVRNDSNYDEYMSTFTIKK